MPSRIRIDNYKNILLFAVGVSAVLLTGPSFASEEGEKSFDIRFGILSEPEPGKYRLARETTRIPKCLAASGFSFGYLIRERAGREFGLETVSYLPSRPKQLTGVLKSQTPSRVLRSPQRHLKGSGASGFRFDAGDPSGQYKLEFHIDGKPYQTIEFEVLDSCEQ